ncbi:MAG: DUF3179 domain-containing protein [Rhodospirillales bacterium]|nr:DUF3179 domain-containing protein [Rhodospirillales bacterium]
MLFILNVQIRQTLGLSVVAGIVFLVSSSAAMANPSFWKFEWPRTDFKKTSVEYGEIMSGGPPKDGIPSIDNPRFTDVSKVKRLKSTVPVISFTLNGESKAYPLGILMRHEIVNDRVGGVPVAVTYCPLCNAAIVFDAKLDGKVLDFGTTGKLRNSDLVMYDRQTESWWQQFLGEGIVGSMTGKKLKMLPSRIEAFGRYKKAHPNGKVLLSAFPGRGFGDNPYVGYDGSPHPFLYRGVLPSGIPALMRVVAVGDEAWSIALLRQKKRIEVGDLVLTWEAGQNSALDTRDISKGKDVGNVVVKRKTGSGLVDAVHDVTFAFTFHAFKPKGKLHHTK